MNVSSKRGERRIELMLMNIALCIIVVFIHICSSPLSAADKGSWKYAVIMIPWRLSSFVVQGFIMLSGIKLFLKADQPFDAGRYYLSRFTKIVIPYILWVFVYYVYFVARGYFPFKIADFLRYVLVGDLSAQFYFIVIIVQFYALAPLWRALHKRINPTLAIAVSLLFTLIFYQYLPNFVDMIKPDYYFGYGDRLFPSYLVYWTIGSVIGANYSEVCEMLIKNKVFIAACTAFFALLDVSMSWLSFTGRKNVYFLETIHYAYVICAAVSALTLALCIVSRRKTEERAEHRLLGFIDSITYPVYLSHCLILGVVDTYIRPSNILRFLLIYVLSFGLCALYRIISNALKHRIKRSEAGA